MNVPTYNPATRTFSVTRACTFCSDDEGILRDPNCPICPGTGRVRVEVGADELEDAEVAGLEPALRERVLDELLCVLVDGALLPAETEDCHDCKGTGRDGVFDAPEDADPCTSCFGRGEVRSASAKVAA